MVGDVKNVADVKGGVTRIRIGNRGIQRIDPVSASSAWKAQEDEDEYVVELI